MNTKELLASLAGVYQGNAYVFLDNVRNGTGYSDVTRTADALALGLWPSRGTELEGFELKVSRSDWLRELKEPAKAEAIVQYCDRWWIVTPDEPIVTPEELPRTWGWMAFNGKKKIVKVDAPKLKPKSITRSFLGSLLRNATSNTVSRGSIQAQLDEAAQAGRNQAKWETERVQRSLDELREKVKLFEQSSGISVFSTWNCQLGDIGQAVKVIMDGGLGEYKRKLENLQQVASQISEGINREVEMISSYKEEVGR